MEKYQVIFSILSAIILFLFGLSSFSHELRTAAGARLQSIMSRVTTNRFTAFIVGATFTAIIQSSTAVTALAVSLVNSGVLNFKGAVAIMLGAYIGTTTTAWLVSLKLTSIGPIFIVLGGILSILPIRAKVLGKAVFYFGFIFFSLDIINTSLEPLRTNQNLIELLLLTNTPITGIIIGAILTVILQSSTVVTGLAIIFVQQGLLLPEQSIPIVLGANIGTTATALVASLNMNLIAKKTAVSNTLINIIGVILIFPFLAPFTSWVLSIAPTPSMAVAVAHLAFNIGLTALFLIFLSQFVNLMDRVFKRSLG